MKPPAPLAELGTVVDDLERLTMCALDACNAGDVAALHDALDRRDALTERLAALGSEVLRAHAAARAARDHGTVDALDAAIRTVVAAARRLDEQNARLAEHAGVLRNDTGVRLARAGHDVAARTAYAASVSAEGSALLDLTR